MNYAIQSIFLLLILMNSGNTPDLQSQLPVNSSQTPILTVWLMPNEPAEEIDPHDPKIALEVKTLNEQLAKRSVTFINTTDTHLREQLLAWNPEYAVPHWGILKGQKNTLNALGRFAEENNIRIRVRFINWSDAFVELRNIINDDSVDYRPDVAQIGSTWVAYFAEKRLLMQPKKADIGKMVWRTLHEKSTAASLCYLQDIRLLYYWKRLPDDPPSSDAFKLNSKNWQSILNSVSAQVARNRPEKTGPPMVMPIGYGRGSLNLLHDYAPLVWAGGGNLFNANQTRIDLTSKDALEVPLLLSKSAVATDEKGLRYRVITFPEMEHQEAIEYFLEGRYLATIEPVFFLRYWNDHFKKEYPEKTFSNYAGVTILPVTFKGSSDLIVTSCSKYPELSLQLAKFISSDIEYNQQIAKLGHLPAQVEGFGIREFSQTFLTNSDLDIEKTIKWAFQNSREYPLMAKWPTEIEAVEVLEATQRLWRQISRGSYKGDTSEPIHTAAEQLEETINSKIHLPTMLWIRYSRPVFVFLTILIIVALVGYGYFQRKVSRFDRKLCVATRILQMRDFVLVSRAGAALADRNRIADEKLTAFCHALSIAHKESEELQTQIRHELGDEKHFRKTSLVFRLLKYLHVVTFARTSWKPCSHGSDVLQDFPSTEERDYVTMELHEILQKDCPSELIKYAWTLAEHQYRVASQSSQTKSLHLAEHLRDYRLHAITTPLVVSLQQWFYNVMKRGQEVDSEVRLQLWQSGSKLAIGIQSPSVFVESSVRPLLPGIHKLMKEKDLPSSGYGNMCQCISQLCYAAYRSYPEYWWYCSVDNHYSIRVPKKNTQDNICESLLIIPLPLKRRS